MPQDRLDHAQQLIDAGKYSQARKVLSKLNTAAARNLLQELDEIDPPNSSHWGVGDYLQTLLIGLVGAVVVGGIAFVVANVIGIPRAAAPVQASVEPGATAVAIVATITPTPSPTPTEIPCLAQEWWTSIQIGFNNTVASLFELSVDKPVPEIQDTETAFTEWITELENSAVSPCVTSARDAIVQTAPAVKAVYQSYVTVSTAPARATTFVKALDTLLVAADALTALEVNAEKDEAVRVVTLYTRSECPALRWYAEHIDIPDYARFQTSMEALNFNAIAEAQQHLRTMQSLRSSFAAETTTIPPCMEPVRNYYLQFMDGMIGFANDMLSNDPAKADQNLKKGQEALASYGVEMIRLSNQAAQEFTAGSS